MPAGCGRSGPAPADSGRVWSCWQRRWRPVPVLAWAAGDGGGGWGRGTVGARSIPPGAGAAAEGSEGRGAVAEPALSFAGLLRQLRAEAPLTQEELAEVAGLSPRSVSDLERGINRTARLDTTRLLADALGLAGPVRVAFVAAARGEAQAAQVLAARRGEASGPSPQPRPGPAAGYRQLHRPAGRAVPAAGSAGRHGRRWRGREHPRDRRDGRGRQDPPSRCTPLTSSAGPSRTGSSSCRCMPTLLAGSRSSLPRRWRACCSPRE